MTPTELETYVRQRYNAVSDNFFSQSEIFSYFWAGEMELVQETFCIQATDTSITSTAGTRAYSLPTNTLGIARAEFDGERIFPNQFIDDDVLTGNRPDEGATGTPENYQVFGDSIYLRPVPSTSSLTLKLYLYKLPTDPNSSGTLDVPSRYHLALADYALYCILTKDKNPGMAAAHLTLWQNHKRLAMQTEKLRRGSDSFQVVKDYEDIGNQSGVW